MALINTPIANMLNGISQQPYTMRLPSQGEKQVNCMPSLVDGLKKRPPTNFIKDISANTYTDAKVHPINRDVDEKYIAIVGKTILGTEFKVIDLDGTEKILSTPDGTSYLDTDTPGSSIKMLSIADYTFIVNTEKTVAMSTDLSTSRGVEGLVYVKQGNYTTDYSVEVNGTKVTYTTLNGDNVGSDAPTIKTTNIASELYTKLVANFSTGWTIVLQDSSISIKKDDGSDFELKTSDSFGDNALGSVKSSIRRFEDLPVIAPRDFTVEVTGEIGGKQDNYFVKFTPTNDTDNFGEGSWEETVAPGVQYKFNAATMPHVLIRESDGTFTFEEAGWGTRSVGNDETVPDPSFVGREVNDLFLFRNRLCFLSSDAISTSRAGEFFELFPSTITTILDNGPIDVSASHTKVSNLRHAVEIEEQMIVFSDETQFTFRGNGELTPETASLRVATEFDAALSAKPQGVGRRIYFAVEHGDYSGMREFYVDPSTESKDAADITAHTPKYLPASLTSIRPSPNKDMLVCVSESDRTKLYIYNMYWSGNEKMQSAWSHWESTVGAIMDVVFFDTTLYLIVRHAGGISLSSMDTEQGATDPMSQYLTHLDRRVAETAVIASYNAGNNRTTLTLPYQADATTYAVTREDGGTTIPGQVLPALVHSNNTIQVQGDQTGKSFYVGDSYTMEYQFSNAVIRESTGQGTRANTAGRLQVLNWQVDFNGTGYFKATVDPLGRASREYVYTGNTLGDGLMTIGVVKLGDGSKRFPVRSRNDRVTVTLTNDTYMPSSFLSAGYEANYITRSRRI